jgi:hypothetical protein
MLGIGFPDRHALPRITPTKFADRELRSPPARAGSFFGASRPLPSVPTKVRLLNRLPTLDLGGGDYSSCPEAAIPRLLSGYSQHRHRSGQVPDIGTVTRSRLTSVISGRQENQKSSPPASGRQG